MGLPSRKQRVLYSGNDILLEYKKKRKEQTDRFVRSFVRRERLVYFSLAVLLIFVCDLVVK